MVSLMLLSLSVATAELPVVDAEFVAKSVSIAKSRSGGIFGGSRSVAIQRGGGSAAASAGGGAAAASAGGARGGAAASAASASRNNAVIVNNRNFVSHGHNNVAFRGSYGYGYNNAAFVFRSAAYAPLYTPTIAVQTFAAYAAPVYGYAAYTYAAPAVYGYSAYGCGVVPAPAPQPIPIEGGVTSELRLFREAMFQHAQVMERHSQHMERHTQATEALHRTLKGGGKQD